MTAYKDMPPWVPMVEAMYRSLDAYTLSLVHALSGIEMGSRINSHKPSPTAEAKPKPSPKPKGRYRKRNLAYWQAKSNGKAQRVAVPNHRGKKKKTA